MWQSVQIPGLDSRTFHNGGSQHLVGHLCSASSDKLLANLKCVQGRCHLMVNLSTNSANVARDETLFSGFRLINKPLQPLLSPQTWRTSRASPGMSFSALLASLLNPQSSFLGVRDSRLCPSTGTFLPGGISSRPKEQTAVSYKG